MSPAKKGTGPQERGGPGDVGHPEMAGLTLLPGVQRQAGALAWLPETRPLRFVLVTSRRTGRWVFPKGSIDEGLTPGEAAAREACEEAGVLGRAAIEPIGRYSAFKIRPPNVWALEVDLYPLRIERVLDDWPEMRQRRRSFVNLAEARQMLEDPEMVALAERLAAAQG